MASKMQEPYIGKPCEHCGYGEYELPINGQEWHVKCYECNTIRMVYEPMPHQVRFHADPHKYRMFAGGYGSAKTITACMEIIDHVLETPGGTTLIGAETYPQLEQTAMKEFFEIFPAELITHHSKQKNYIDTVNGHRVLFRSLDEEQKARSLNLTAFWIEEANGVAYEYFVQLQTRLRNRATDKHIGILSTNPDQNWIKTEILLKAHRIYNTDENYMQTDINKDISVHIAPTHLNTHLPPTFYEDTARNKPDWWIRRYLEGSFENKTGLVYPMWEEHLVDDFPIPDFWHRRIGGDFGLNNATGFGMLATDPETGITYLYKEHKESKKPVKHHADILHEQFLKNISYGILKSMVGDSSGQQKTAGDQSSVFDHYAEYGIYWTPATKKLTDSIMKMYSYLELDKFKIFRSCTSFIEEISQYKYPERKLNEQVTDEKKYEKPIAVNDHLLDAVRYVIAELPDDPSRLINKSYNAQHIIRNQFGKQSKLPHALQDNARNTYSRKDAWRAY